MPGIEFPQGTGVRQKSGIFSPGKNFSRVGKRSVVQQAVTPSLVGGGSISSCYSYLLASRTIPSFILFLFPSLLYTQVIFSGLPSVFSVCLARQFPTIVIFQQGSISMMSSILKLRAVPAAVGLVSRGSRTILQRQTFRPTVQRQIARPQFRRAYASEAAPVAKPPKKKLRFVKYAWRGTYTLAIAGTVWLAYSIYETRFPKEQIEPDPTKKTLVILGMSSFSLSIRIIRCVTMGFNF